VAVRTLASLPPHVRRAALLRQLEAANTAIAAAERTLAEERAHKRAAELALLELGPVAGSAAPSDPEYISAQTAAARYDVSPSLIYKLADQGVIAECYVGTSRRFSLASIQAYIARQAGARGEA
jgi:excisionase family DNA binding protein